MSITKVWAVMNPFEVMVKLLFGFKIYSIFLLFDLYN
jgi:hypothetical protein